MTLLLLLGIALLGELIEFISGLYGAKKFGASRLGMMFAFPLSVPMAMALIKS